MKKIKGINVKTLFQYGLVGLMVAGAFWTGSLYREVQTLRGGRQAALGTGAGAVPTQPQVREQTNLTEKDWEELVTNPVTANGSDEAQVTIVEFTDYQCPFCKRFFDQTAEKINQEYVDTGKVRYLIRDLPLSFHGNAKAAALAARCAGVQGAYSLMHDKLFENQDEWANGNPDEQFAQYAVEIGVNQGGFSACYEGEEFGEQIDDDVALANRVGATGTPTFFINGRPLVGAQPFSAFEAIIEEELAK
jgi:protein-disulfide isomerase